MLLVLAVSFLQYFLSLAFHRNDLMFFASHPGFVSSSICACSPIIRTPYALRSKKRSDWVKGKVQIVHGNRGSADRARAHTCTRTKIVPKTCVPYHTDLMTDHIVYHGRTWNLEEDGKIDSKKKNLNCLESVLFSCGMRCAFCFV